MNVEVIPGAPATLRSAFDDHYEHLLRLATLLAGGRDAAEDIVQEAYVRVAPRLSKVATKGLRGYLRQTVINVWRSHVRRAAIERRLVRRQGLGLGQDRDLPLEERDVLWEAVRRLPTRQRACLVLRYYEDLSERQAAQLLGCSIGSVKSQTSRALVRLRKDLDHEN